MPSTEVTICNLALGEIGDKRIVGLTDDSAQARACRLFYDQTRDEVLRSHRWNFAIKRAKLSKLSIAPAFGWSMQFQLPNDCLRVLQVNGYEEYEREGKWEVEGRCLLSDCSEAKLKYIARIEDATQFDPLFVEALAVKLASKIAQSLTGSRSLPGELIQKYERITGPLARKADAFESSPKVKPWYVNSDLVAARFGGGILSSSCPSSETAQTTIEKNPTYIICNAFGSSGTLTTGAFERFRLYADGNLIWELDGVTEPNWVGDTAATETTSIPPAVVKVPAGTKEVYCLLQENSNGYPVAPQTITPPYPSLTTGSSWYYRFIFIGGTSATKEDQHNTSGFKYSPASGDSYWGTTGKTGVETKVFTQQISS